MEKVSDHVFWVRDTCSVYGVVADGFTMLIDCGTHFFASPDMHVSLPRVEQVLLTHFHRDQCAAAEKWSRQGATIVIPFAERRFLEESDLQRAAYDIYDNYTSYYPCFGPLRDVDATDYAHDYETLRWRGFSFAVIPLPGHTFGSAGYLFEGIPTASSIGSPGGWSRSSACGRWNTSYRPITTTNTWPATRP